MSRVAVIEGEDAAPEAMRPTVALLDRLGLGIEWLRPPVDDDGSAARRAIDSADATLFGSTSGPSARALFYLRWGRRPMPTFGHAAGARVPSPLVRPEGIDLVIVRENLEDLYVGVEGELALRPTDTAESHVRASGRGAGPGSVRAQGDHRRGRRAGGSVRVRAGAAAEGGGRPGKVTCGTKHNMLPRSDGLFREVAARVARGYPDIAFEVFIVDDLAHRLVVRPHDLDVVVLPNLYGDVLSDAAAGLIGGLGLAPSGCYGDAYAYFEPAHGSAPDIAGRNVINPTATILSAMMMLDHLGHAEAAQRLETAITRVYATGNVLTPDQGGRASTTEFCEAVASHL